MKISFQFIKIYGHVCIVDFFSVGGHDSNEDAMACMELVLWKVKEEAKLI